MSLPANTKPVRSIAEQTGWKRLMPQTICQDVDVLIRITEYSFDTSNREFLCYFENRTGVYIGADPQHPQILSRIERGLMQPLPSDYFEMQCAFANMSDAEYLATSRNLRVHQIFRGKLQDCWEIYSTNTQQSGLSVGQLPLW